MCHLIALHVYEPSFYLVLKRKRVYRLLQLGTCPPIRHHCNGQVTIGLIFNGRRRCGTRRVSDVFEHGTEWLNKIGKVCKDCQVSAAFW